MSRRLEGQGLVEYGLVITLVALVAMGGIAAFGGNLLSLFQGFGLLF
jgi:Flp pilus assembly pilin Flp